MAEIYIRLTSLLVVYDCQTRNFIDVLVVWHEISSSTIDLHCYESCSQIVPWIMGAIQILS